ncbi:hypothetical protein [Spiribacter insolitus]|uniref:YrhK domain-containing protein n=1 Tax=Spiribacter insolitus TaxID=3122417 RepID=A0ABV3T6R0_9GAMM
MITRGVAGFVTFRRFQRHGREVIWRARQHRKGLQRHHRDVAAPFWQRPGYNAGTASFFAVGSLLFMLGAGLSLVPNPLTPTQIAIVFFAGSIPFTIGGFLQNFQAANTTDFSPSGDVQPGRRLHLVGWRPGSLGWLSTVTQFIGTVAFNFNTFDAIHPIAGWYDQDITIWVPGMIGSVLFLVSGYLAFMEASHGFWSWRPASLDWWIVSVNLLGCIFFMTAAITAFIPDGRAPAWIGIIANVHLWLGGACFFIAALLTIIESRQSEAANAAAPGNQPS